MNDGHGALVVTAVLVEGRAKSKVARKYGVSRRWVITLVQRYLAEGERGLQPRSRRPLATPGRTLAAIENEIVVIRKDLDKHGHEAAVAVGADGVIVYVHPTPRAPCATARRRCSG